MKSIIKKIIFILISCGIVGFSLPAYTLPVKLLRTVVDPIPSTSEEKNKFYIIGNPLDTDVRYIIKGETETIILNNENNILQRFITYDHVIDTKVVFDTKKDTYIIKQFYKRHYGILSNSGKYFGLSEIKGEIDESEYWLECNKIFYLRW